MIKKLHHITSSTKGTQQVVQRPWMCHRLCSNIAGYENNYWRPFVYCNRHWTCTGEFYRICTLVGCQHRIEWTNRLCFGIIIFFFFLWNICCVGSPRMLFNRTVLLGNMCFSIIINKTQRPVPDLHFKRLGCKL